MLNNEVYVETARAFARRILKERFAGDADRVIHAFRLCVARPPAKSEVARLVKLLEVNRVGFRGRAGEAAKLAG